MGFNVSGYRGVSFMGKGSTEFVVNGSHKELPQELLDELKAICQVFYRSFFIFDCCSILNEGIRSSSLSSVLSLQLLLCQVTIFSFLFVGG